MHPVQFITTEIGDDLILSFVIRISDEPGEVKSLILLRTPKFEGLLFESERGVNVSLEGDDDDDDLLKVLAYDKSAAEVHITTLKRQYDLDVHRVDEEEIRSMCRILDKMNFDQRIKLVGV